MSLIEPAPDKPHPACPFTLQLVVNQIAGLAPQTQVVAGPCLQDKCAIWDEHEQACAIKALGPRLDLLNAGIHRQAESGEATATALSATLGARGAT